MKEDRIKLPRLDEKGIDGKGIYNYRKWLERFKHTKRKYEIDIRPLIEEETTTGTEWNTKRKRARFYRALGPEATHQITRSAYRTETDSIERD